MDLVLVGLPGSGKSVVGKRLAQRHGAAFIDLDEIIEREAGRSIPDIFAVDGEPEFRRREREAVRALGPASGDSRLRRVIATGGGAVVDPRNRWLLLRGRVPVWLDGRPEVLAQRLRRSRNVRPLIAGRDPIGAVRGLAAARERFYAAAHRQNAVAEVGSVMDAVDRLVADGPTSGTVLLRGDTRLGRITLGDRHAGPALVEALRDAGATRAIVLTEPVAWAAVSARLVAALDEAGLPHSVVMLPTGEAAKTLSVIETVSRELAGLRVERREPIVAVGGGALGDAAGFAAAVYLRGVPVIHVPTTLVAQIDSSIGGKTAVDLPEGKNLVGAFHQPAAVIVDVSLLATLPDRERRAALAEAVKMAALGDERLFALLESDGESIASGAPSAYESGALAELVERTGWAKVEVVSEDQREQAGRITLNLGHSLGHAFEAAAGYGGLLHGEAVAYGLRAATRIGLRLGVTPLARAQRIERLLTELSLATAQLDLDPARVSEALATDKKHAAGHLQWVLPTEDGVTIRTDVPVAVVMETAADVMRGTPAASAGAAGAAGPVPA
jgi:3-dehydroquinate synthase